MVPSVFFVREDPVKLGLVESQGSPGGNATGANYIVGDAVAQRLAFLHELLPKAVRIAVLTNPANAVATEALLPRLEEGARSLGLQIAVLRASTAAEIDTAFDTMGRDSRCAICSAGHVF